MRNIGAFEAKTHFSEILEQISHGQQFVITKHGHPVAKIIPFEERSTVDISTAIDDMRKFIQQNKIKLAGLDWKKLRDTGKKL